VSPYSPRLWEATFIEAGSILTDLVPSVNELELPENNDVADES
jgi:hypothetical protein